MEGPCYISLSKALNLLCFSKYPPL
uniref:Uncharacterized protein n=1 Tax=Anguilla anguilla TaxID=7936 RepID=A0A0E9V451_ANGAN